MHKISWLTALATPPATPARDAEDGGPSCVAEIVLPSNEQLQHQARSMGITLAPKAEPLPSTRTPTSERLSPLYTHCLAKALHSTFGSRANVLAALEYFPRLSVAQQATVIDTTVALLKNLVTVEAESLVELRQTVKAMRLTPSAFHDFAGAMAEELAHPATLQTTIRAHLKDLHSHPHQLQAILAKIPRFSWHGKAKVVALPKESSKGASVVGALSIEMVQETFTDPLVSDPKSRLQLLLDFVNCHAEIDAKSLNFVLRSIPIGNHGAAKLSRTELHAWARLGVKTNSGEYCHDIRIILLAMDRFRPTCAADLNGLGALIAPILDVSNDTDAPRVRVLLHRNLSALRSTLPTTANPASTEEA